jgi:hypothetical protein
VVGASRAGVAHGGCAWGSAWELRAWRMGLQLGPHLCTQQRAPLMSCLPTRASCRPPSTKHQLSCAALRASQSHTPGGGHTGDLDQGVLPVNKPEVSVLQPGPHLYTHAPLPRQSSCRQPTRALPATCLSVACKLLAARCVHAATWPSSRQHAAWLQHRCLPAVSRTHVRTRTRLGV